MTAIPPTARAAALLLCAGAAAPALAQLRIATWNVSNYTGSGREAAFRTAVYGSYQGRSMSPDVLICQEFASAQAVAAFRAILNTAPGSPGDWEAAPFIDGPDTDNALFYRGAKVALLGASIAVQGGDPSGPPRHVIRYDVRPVGYSAAATTVACYSTHMKAGSTQEDQTRRYVEAAAIRASANALPAGWNFLLAGDLNIQNSTQAAYQQLVGSLANNRGRFFDPINTPGNWNNTESFRFVHTQAPGSAGAGMDDRFDIVLLSDSLSDGADFDYIGERAVPYSTTTWNDPAHSYRAWGNDGTSFNQPIALGNAMVGGTIAQALRDAAATDGSGGHLPVLLDLRVPAKVGAPATLDFGEVPQGAAVELNLPVANAGDTGLWGTAGIAGLTYSLAATPGIQIPAGPFVAGAGVQNEHRVRISTQTPGPLSGSITITSSSVEHPVVQVALSATVVASCYANCDQSTAAPILNVADFTCFLQAYAAGESYANCDGSTEPPALNVADFTCFLQSFAAGCP